MNKLKYLLSRNIKKLIMRFSDDELIGARTGPSKLKNLSDTNISSPTDGYNLVYDSASKKWVAAAASSANLTGHITSVGTVTSLNSFTVAQLSTALSDATLSGSNTGDQTDMSAISDSKADFNTALSDGTFIFTGDAPTSHASSHAVGGADTIFPADPGADKILQWDDSESALAWVDAGTGSGDFFADGTVPMTGRLDLATGTTVLAPIKFTSGTNLTTEVAGVVEFNGSDLFITIA